MSTQTTAQPLTAMGQRARAAALKLARLSTEVKNRALLNIASALEERSDQVVAANRKDYQAGQRNGLNEGLLDRLLLNHERLAGMARDVRTIAELPDPVGEE